MKKCRQHQTQDAPDTKLKKRTSPPRGDIISKTQGDVEKTVGSMQCTSVGRVWDLKATNKVDIQSQAQESNVDPEIQIDATLLKP
jgi:hypothetical protein